MKVHQGLETIESEFDKKHQIGASKVPSEPTTPASEASPTSEPRHNIVSRTASPLEDADTTDSVRSSKTKRIIIEWIRPSTNDANALGKGMFPFLVNDTDSNQLVIHDIAIRGTVVLIDLRAEVKFNHVIDIRVDERAIQRIKKFIHRCPKVPSEDSGKLRWNDTPIRPPGNIMHCVNKKSTHMEFAEVWDARGLDDPLTIAPEERIDL